MIEINKEKLSKFINLKYVHICPFFKDQSFKRVLRIHRRLAPHSPSIQVACRKWYGHPGHHTLHIWCTYIYMTSYLACCVFCPLYTTEGCSCVNILPLGMSSQTFIPKIFWNTLKQLRLSENRDPGRRKQHSVSVDHHVPNDMISNGLLGYGILQDSKTNSALFSETIDYMSGFQNCASEVVLQNPERLSKLCKSWKK
jgi:hypothetical protein